MSVRPRDVRRSLCGALQAVYAFSTRVYRQGNPVERFFNSIEQFRGLATRYDRNPDNCLAALELAAVRIRLAAT